MAYAYLRNIGHSFLINRRDAKNIILSYVRTERVATINPYSMTLPLLKLDHYTLPVNNSGDLQLQLNRRRWVAQSTHADLRAHAYQSTGTLKESHIISPSHPHKLHVLISDTEKGYRLKIFLFS